MNRPQRNKNPGNMSTVPGWWRGQIGEDRKLAIFAAPFWGWRAIILDITTALAKTPNTTLAQWLSEYAPPNENNTQEYIDFVVSKTTVGYQQLPAKPTSLLSDIDIPSLLHAIATMEGWYAQT